MQTQEIIALCIVAMAAVLLVGQLVLSRKKPVNKGCDNCACGEQKPGAMETGREKHPQRL